MASRGPSPRKQMEAAGSGGRTPAKSLCCALPPDNLILGKVMPLSIPAPDPAMVPTHTDVQGNIQPACRLPVSRHTCCPVDKTSEKLALSHHVMLFGHVLMQPLIGPMKPWARSWEQHRDKKELDASMKFSGWVEENWVGGSRVVL